MKRNELFLSLIALVWIGTLFAFFIKMETPLGSIEGIVLTGENGKPIQGAEVSLSPEAWDFKRAYKAKTDEEGHFLLAGIPASKYFLYCQSSAHYLADERERYVQIKEGERKKIVLKLSRSETSISIWADKSV
ncbi:MAG: carboxypeptidase regulatory-like domain-containing protein, partial [Chloroflexi bacterium]|nr:carboxypeptidase regulatory-like domain-containing protein [Chloroflexota bacterium]